MPETYEKDGIVYFKEPYKVKFSDWISKYLNCDYIVDKSLSNFTVIYVLCYAKDASHNLYLRKVLDSDYPNGRIYKGVDSTEVNCID